MSGPLLDRIDLHVNVARLQEEQLSTFSNAETSFDIRLRVMRAVEIQQERCGKNPFLFNGQMTQKQLVKHCKIDEQSRLMLARAVHRLGLSARAYDRVLRISRTIADINAHEDIQSSDLAEAINYRSPVRERFN